MMTSKLEKNTCSICGITSNNTKFPLPCILTPFLSEKVVICDKCVVKKLTGKDIDWKDNVKQFLEYNNK